MTEVLEWVWARATWANVLAVVNPAITWAWVARLAVACGLGWAAWEFPREAAEAALVVAAVAAVRARRRARRSEAAAAKALAKLQAAFDAQVGERVAAGVAALAAANALLQTERDEAVARRDEAERTVARLDRSGQFVACCLRWAAARKTKRVPVVKGVSLDADYWWKQIEAVAKARWAGHAWQADELLQAAEQVAGEFDMVTWRRVVNSEFGVTLTV